MSLIIILSITGESFSMISDDIVKNLNNLKERIDQIHKKIDEEAELMQIHQKEAMKHLLLKSEHKQKLFIRDFQGLQEIRKTVSYDHLVTVLKKIYKYDNELADHMAFWIDKIETISADEKELLILYNQKNDFESRVKK
jgi:hypothetical protein